MAILTPLTAAHGLQLEALGPDMPLPRLRWYMHTPYATVLGLKHEGAWAAVAGVLHFGTHAHIGLLHGPLPALLPALRHHLLAAGAERITLHATAAQAPMLDQLGFAPVAPFTLLAGGRFLNASLDEVVLLEPGHTLALLHLAQHSLGMDLRPLLLEHRFAAHAWVEHGRVRGGLLPLLGHGLVVADAPHIGLELQRWLLPHQDHIVVPTANTAACAHLAKQGYTAASAGSLYVHGAPLPCQPALVFAWPWGM